MGDYELDPAAKDDLLEVEPALVVGLFYRLTESNSIYFENELQYKNEYYSEIGKTYNKWIVERQESWIYFGNVLESEFSLQIGRQSYEDERQWWWDEQLDSVRLHYDTDNFHSELALAQELARESTEDDRMDPEKEDILRALGHSAYSQDDALRLDVFALYQDDHSDQPEQEAIVKPYLEDESDADLFWYGARLSGEIEADDMGEFLYWVDAAGITGDETLFEFEEEDEGDNVVDEIIKRDVSGWGVDTGITWRTGILSDMAMTLGYARGSGDKNPDERTDRSFRQTGLNEGDMRFQYYGELLNPDLSNLQIWTISVGFELWESSFVDFIYHNYRQVHPADFLRESDIEADPEGVSKSVGDEFDLVVNIEQWEDYEVEFSGSMFHAGDAFGPLSGETAYRLMMEINYLF
jgi:hypothetical protein